MASPHRKNSEPYCSRFGTIASELGFLTREQLMQGLDEQVDDDLNGRPHRVIGAICFGNGWLTPEQIERVLNRMFQERSGRKNLRLAAG